MKIHEILFFALLVTSAITQIYSAPGGISSKPKPPESFGNEIMLREMYKTKQWKYIYENSAASNSKTVSMHPEAVHGDEGYISPRHMEPSGSNPSEKYRKDSGMIGPNPFDVDFLNNEKTKKKSSKLKSSLLRLSEKLGRKFGEILENEYLWSLNHKIKPEEEVEKNPAQTRD